MEFELFMSKNAFLKELIKEIKRTESSLWDYLKSDTKEEIPHKLNHMQETIVQVLRILNEIEVEVFLFKIEKSEKGRQIEKELEELYLLLEKQKNQLFNIKEKSSEEITKILDGSNSGLESFSENSQKINSILEQLETGNNE